MSNLPYIDLRATVSDLNTPPSVDLIQFLGGTIFGGEVESQVDA